MTGAPAAHRTNRQKTEEVAVKGSFRILIAASLLCASTSYGQSYPAKPVRIVVPLAPGGNVDLVVRAFTQQISENSGFQFVIENRPGASSLVGTQYVAKTPPDGYTFL